MSSAKDQTPQPKVPTERPDPKTAARGPGPDGETRPGFDLGGQSGGEAATTGTVTPGGPRSDPGQGGTATGRASGLTDLSGSRSLGNEQDSGSGAGGGPTSGSGGPT